MQSAEEALRETLGILKSVADATSAILSHEVDTGAKKAYLPELGTGC
jgi:hypothetical protein